MKLKSGGPAMTVQQVGMGTDKAGVKCIWFSSNDMKREEIFSAVLLKRTSAPA